ncbi:MAG TPA: CpaF/VirB11 family protein [Candidatus Paenibacillus intestinavium]|nr:CpaF/VirB11 family protein [Candidatus Paenibacillus intestinavium]
MTDNEIKRFSAIEFMSRHKAKVDTEPKDNGSSLQFQTLCNEMRSFLSTPRGLSEEERREYSESLNQAVLGFPAARQYILNIITDRLLKLHINEIEHYEHPYPSLAEAIFSEVVGMHVLEIIIRDTDGLEEIQVVGTNIYTIIRGEVSLSPYRFEQLKEVERIQQNLVLFNNDHINMRKRWAEVMLRDGSRVTITGHGYTALPTLTIRFYTLRNIPLSQLATAPYRMMSPSMLTIFQLILQNRYNLVLIGPTNTGKTNLLKACIAELPAEERLVTIEGRYEMMISRDYPNRNIIEYEINEDDYLHSSNQAFKLALRQSPQRIIHAEIRDDDANIYVRACTRGHHGSMTTVHANQLEDVPEAIVDMCMLDGRGMDANRLAKRITQFVTEIGIQLQLVNGRRIITRIGRLHWDNNEVRVTDWVTYDPEQDQWTIHWHCIRRELPHIEEGVG